MSSATSKRTKSHVQDKTNPKSETTGATTAPPAITGDKKRSTKPATDKPNTQPLDVDNGSFSKSVETTTFKFCLESSKVKEFIPTCGKRRLQGDWCAFMYNAFHGHWASCGLVFTSNYLCHGNHGRTGRPYWSGYAHCKVPGCVKVKFQIMEYPVSGHDATVVCTVTGKCIHDKESLETPGKSILILSIFLIKGFRKLM